MSLGPTSHAITLPVSRKGKNIWTRNRILFPGKFLVFVLYTLPISDLDPTPISCICHAQLSPHTELNVAGFGSSKQAARMKAAMIGSIWLSNAGKSPPLI